MLRSFPVPDGPFSPREPGPRSVFQTPFLAFPQNPVPEVGPESSPPDQSETRSPKSVREVSPQNQSEKPVREAGPESPLREVLPGELCSGSQQAPGPRSQVPKACLRTRREPGPETGQRQRPPKPVREALPPCSPAGDASFDIPL